jgi:hypothetical protein
VNATVRQVVNAIRVHVPSLEVRFVDNQIMNQLSYEVLNARFAKEGFKGSGSLEEGIADSVRLLRNANHG